MGQIPSQPYLPSEELARLRLSSGLTTKQLDRLYTRFCLLDRYGVGYLTPTDLLRIPQLAANPVYRQIVDTFFPSWESDVRLGFDKFVEVFAVILIPHSGPFGRSKPGRPEKLRFLTQMFDFSQSGCIMRVDFQRTMRCLLNSSENKNKEQEPEKEPEMAAELKLLELQAFGDNTKDRVSYEEFEERLCVADIELSIAKWSSMEDGYESVDEVDQAEVNPLGSDEVSGLKKLKTSISNYFLSIVDIFYQ